MTARCIGVFDTFPWPQSPTRKQIAEVAAAAVALRALRREIISGLILSLISCLPLTHGSNWTDGELNAITSMSERRRS